MNVVRAIISNWLKKTWIVYSKNCILCLTSVVYNEIFRDKNWWESQLTLGYP